MTKKGFSLSIELVVYLLLAVIVLATLIFIFSDQSSEFFSSIGRFFKIANESVPK
jgi:hypothetical protein